MADLPNRNRVVIPESAGDADDMRIRADREASLIESLIIELTVTVKGWINPKTGGLWEPMKHITVDAPSLLIKPSDDLGIQAAVFQQGPQGSTTTLTIVRFSALGVAGANSPMGPAKVQE